MAGWIDSDPLSPIVQFEQDDGTRVPIPRARAASFGFLPPSVADAVQQMPESEPAPAVLPPPVAPTGPGFAALRPPLPEGGASAFGQGALAPGGQPVSAPPQFAPPPPVVEAAPVADAVSGGGPAEVPAAPHASLPGVGYVPAMVANPETWVREKPPGPQSMEEVDQQLADQRVAIGEQAEVDAENLAFTQEKQRQEEQKRLQQISADAEGAINRAAAYKIDPNRKFANMGTARTVATIVMAAISGLGSALKKQGDKNPAIDIIRAAFEQDVALQMDERAQLGSVATQKRGALDDLRGVFKNRDAERSARMSALWQRSALEWGQAEAAAGSQRVKLTYQELRAGAAKAAEEEAYNTVVEEAKTVSKLEHEAAETEKLRAETDVLRRKAAGGGSGAASKDFAGTYKSLRDIDPKLVDQAVLMPDGSYVIAVSTAAKKEADAALVTSGQLVQNIDRALTKLTDSPGFSEKIKNRAGWTTEDTAVIQQELAQLQGSGKNYLGLGALSESDFELMKQMGADVNSVNAFFEQAFPKLQNWRRGVVQDGASKIRQYISRDVDQEGAFGKAPEKPRAQSSGDWYAQITSPPTRDGGAIVAAPNISDAEEAIKGMRESWTAEGRTDKEWQGELGSMAARVRRERNAARGRIVSLNEKIDKLEKKADKGASKPKAKRGDPWAAGKSGDDRSSAEDEKLSALRLRKIEEAAAMSNYDGIEKRINAAKQQSIQSVEKKAKETTAKKAAAQSARGPRYEGVK